MNTYEICLITCNFLLNFLDHFLILSPPVPFAVRFVLTQFVPCLKAHSTQPCKNLNDKTIHNKM